MLPSLSALPFCNLGGNEVGGRDLFSGTQVNQVYRVGKMVQRGKAVLTKAEKLSPIPGTHILEENLPFQAVL